jgi:hypothetical protein
MTILSKTEPHVQESSVSPYLLQPTRSLDEARKEIGAKRSAARDSKWFLRHHTRAQREAHRRRSKGETTNNSIIAHIADKNEARNSGPFV